MQVNKKTKIAIFHHFFKNDCKGGGESLVLTLREFLKADLWVGALGWDKWGKQNIENDKEFAGRVWDKRFGFEYLHLDSSIKFWSHLKRQLYFLFSPKVKKLNKYDLVIFSYGNIAFVPERLNSKVKKIMYCHTPPRAFTDGYLDTLNKLPTIIKPVFKIFRKWVLSQWDKSASKMDLIVANSQNIKNRIEKYTKTKVHKVVFPPVDVDRFKWIEQGDYFLSYARLESLKRIELILEAFANMPDQKLVICSGGPLQNYVQNQIQSRNLTNITFEGRVSNSRLEELVGKCLAGIYIPKDEDAGITQCEIMSAGKPVIGVKEGGLLETIIDQKTGCLLPKNPTVQDLQTVIQNFDSQKALKMRKDCQTQAYKFRTERFFEEMIEAIEEV